MRSTMLELMAEAGGGTVHMLNRWENRSDSCWEELLCKERSIKGGCYSCLGLGEGAPGCCKGGGG